MSEIDLTKYMRGIVLPRPVPRPPLPNAEVMEDPRYPSRIMVRDYAYDRVMLRDIPNEGRLILALESAQQEAGDERKKTKAWIDRCNKIERAHTLHAELLAKLAEGWGEA